MFGFHVVDTLEFRFYQILHALKKGVSFECIFFDPLFIR